MSAQAENLGPPFARSLVLHGALFGALIGWQLWTNYAREKWGDPNANPGGSVTITPTATIPIQQRPAPPNPVANDTESVLPTPAEVKPVPQEKKVVDDRDAIAIKKQKQIKKQTDIAAQKQKFRPWEPPDNQLTSNAAPRTSSPMLAVKGSGGVGTGQGSSLGTRFGWYEALIRQRISEKWNTQDVDSGIRTLPVSIVTFTIRRDGSVGNVRVAKSSGNYAMDTSAQRAIYEAAPLPPLPPEFERNSAAIEFWFELKR